MADSKTDFYVVSVEDHVIQITSYIVRADSKEKACDLVANGIYAFESDVETVDTVSSEIKTVEEIA